MNRVMASLIILAALMNVAASAADSTGDFGTNGAMFNTEEILDESTLDIKTLQDWHPDKSTGSTRQKLIEINVAQWLPGKDYRIPVRMIVPIEGKAKGFHISGFMTERRRVRRRSCMCRFLKTNGWIWNVTPRPARGPRPYR